MKIAVNRANISSSHRDQETRRNTCKLFPLCRQTAIELIRPACLAPANAYISAAVAFNSGVTPLFRFMNSIVTAVQADSITYPETNDERDDERDDEIWIFIGCFLNASVLQLLL